VRASGRDGRGWHQRCARPGKADVALPWAQGPKWREQRAVTHGQGRFAGYCLAAALSDATSATETDLGFAFVYNALGIPLRGACNLTGCVLAPMMTAMHMSLSSASVIQRLRLGTFSAIIPIEQPRR